jgi:SAM-dependent methyltransferase
MSEPIAYLHGFTATEQQRLLDQADFLAPWVYAGVQLPQTGELLEVGAGVGAQTRHLLERTPAPIVALEFVPGQLQALQQVLAEPLRTGRVRAVRADARAIPFPDGHFSAAFVCWVLEHIPGPTSVLREALRVLRPGGQITVTEVHNQSLTLLPPDPELAQFWAALNATQLAMEGDPFVGPRLGGLLARCGYTDIRISFVPVHGDARDPERRRAMLEYFRLLLQSGVEAVRARRGGSAAHWAAVIDRAFGRAAADPDAVFLYTFAQATARRPE